MTTSVADFDYELPKSFIAQTPAVPRESAKLMVLKKVTGIMDHKNVSDLPDFFHSGDILVINNTKVFHARLRGYVNGVTVELFLVRPHKNNSWLALGKPGKKFTVNSIVTIASDFTGTVVGNNQDGTFFINFEIPPQEVIEKANIYGEVPVPPYIKQIPNDRDYQTVYAKYMGSVAAPTAGFHLTKNILTRLTDKGVKILEITLHVGIGTFMPMKTETIEEHVMHGEWVEVKPDVSAALLRAKKEKHRIIAVGTTTVRTLEGTRAQPYSGDIDLFITPGYKFQIVDAMLTNFHLPKSTLIVLVSAFAGREKILHAYKEAISHKYRFYSFGDAMLII
jgi:S-adenosylmethionine:tRNA ribosyltransferase-isomerase